MSGDKDVCRDRGKSAAPRLDRAFEGRLKPVGAADFHGVKLQTEFSCRQSAFLPCSLRIRKLRIPQQRNAREIGNGFLEQLQSLTRQYLGNRGESGEVSTGPRQGVNQSKRDGILQV